MNDAIPSSGPITTQVYPAISHAEFGRLLAKYGYDTEPVCELGRIGYRTLSQPRFTAWMQTPFKGRAESRRTHISICGATGASLPTTRSSCWAASPSTTCAASSGTGRRISSSSATRSDGGCG